MKSSYWVLDPACGSRMFWFDKEDPRAYFGDLRYETHILCDGRELQVRPDFYTDFRNLDLPDEAFYHVVFDPPHLISLGKESWTAKKYGRLLPTWEDDLRLGFSECFRVLKPFGTLIFKWNETQVPLSRVLALTPEKPLYGHKSGRASKTHWVAFLKSGDSTNERNQCSDHNIERNPANG